MLTVCAMELAHSTDFSFGASMGQLSRAHSEKEIVHTVTGCEQTVTTGKATTTGKKAERGGKHEETCTWEELRNKSLVLQQPEMSSLSQAGARRRRELALGWANTDAGAEWEHSQPLLFLTGAEEAFTFHYEGWTKCPSVVLNLFTGWVGVAVCKAPGPSSGTSSPNPPQSAHSCTGQRVQQLKCSSDTYAEGCPNSPWGFLPAHFH